MTCTRSSNVVVRCCKELQLKAGDKKQLTVQFQMNRLWFCQQHFAVDCMYQSHFVFPDLHLLRRVELQQTSSLGCVLHAQKITCQHLLGYYSLLLLSYIFRSSFHNILIKTKLATVSLRCKSHTAENSMSKFACQFSARMLG